MKRKLKLKSYVLPSLYVCLFIATFYITLVVSNMFATKTTNKEQQQENLDYVSETIIDNSQQVINEKEKMIKPYTNENVKIGKYFYDYKAENNKQENSITYHDNTYMQNSGVDYILEESFDVVSVLNGTVTSVKTDDLLGKIVEIKHDNNYVTVYQSLSTVDVKKGDVVTQGQIIGKSGTNEIDKDMGNHLHFELYIKGQIVDPILYIDKEISVIANNDEGQTENQQTTENSQKQEESTRDSKNEEQPAENSKNQLNEED